jgi:inorganic pyrophosphatase
MTFPKPFFRWRPHPWHGLPVGIDPPQIVHAYIEITPFDLVKYEVDKSTGYMKVDRPQRTSSQPPTLYGFIPQTYCGRRVGEMSAKAKRGDGDPMDICVFSERQITKSEVILNVRVVGGIQMIDHEEADDKIIAVLLQDGLWGKVTDVTELPGALIDRLTHYFLTYKRLPGDELHVVIEEIYGREKALKVVEASIKDYDDMYGVG